jgi:hypothetical protein
VFVFVCSKTPFTSVWLFIRMCDISLSNNNNNNNKVFFLDELIDMQSRGTRELEVRGTNIVFNLNFFIRLIEKTFAAGNAASWQTE